jgi:hypothetical protein
MASGFLQWHLLDDHLDHRIGEVLDVRTLLIAIKTQAFDSSSIFWSSTYGMGATMSNSGGTGSATVSNISLLRPFCEDPSLSIDQVSSQPQLSHKLGLIEVEVKTSELSASYLQGYNEGNLNGLAGGRDSARWRI